MKSIFLSIAGINTRIYCEDTDFINQSKERYANFIVTDIKPEIDINVQIIEEDNQNVEDSEIQIPKVNFLKEKETWTLKWHSIGGEFNIKSNKGILKCYNHPSGLNSFLRFIYSLILLKDDGFLIHAASLVRKGNTLIFPGKQDVGKTTISQLSSSTILSDDISLIKIMEGNIKAYGTPFWGALAVGGENIVSNLNKIYFPVKDKRNYVKKLTKKQCMERILPNVISFTKDPLISKKLFNLSLNLADLPAYELHFLPDESFWGLIDNDN